MGSPQYPFALALLICSGLLPVCINISHFSPSHSPSIKLALRGGVKDIRREGVSEESSEAEPIVPPPKIRKLCEKEMREESWRGAGRGELGVLMHEERGSQDSQREMSTNKISMWDGARGRGGIEEAAGVEDWGHLTSSLTWHDTTQHGLWKSAAFGNTQVG